MEIHKTVERIEGRLKEKNISYKKFIHEPVRTSKEAAEVRDGFSIQEGAKALIVRVKADKGKQFVMLVVPGDKRFDTKKVKQCFSAKDIRFASEEEVHDITEGVEPGGVPPFGSIFGLRTYVDTLVLKNEHIVFNAGDKKVSIAVRSDDYMRVEAPTETSLV